MSNSELMSMSASQRFGFQIELWVRLICEEKGLNPVPGLTFFEAYDFSIMGNKVIEVKAAVASSFINNCGRRKKRWCFNLARGVENPDFYILVCVVAENRYAFVVPGHVLLGKKSVQITSHPTVYKGFLRSYLFAWHLLDGQTEPDSEGLDEPYFPF